MDKILLIGNKNCARCDMTKKILNDKGVKFDYVILTDLSQDLQDKYIAMAQEKHQLSMPLIIKDNTIITLQEV